MSRRPERLVQSDGVPQSMYPPLYIPSPRLVSTTTPISAPFLPTVDVSTVEYNNSSTQYQLSGDVPRRPNRRDEQPSRMSSLVIVLLLVIAGLSIAILVLLNKTYTATDIDATRIESDLLFIKGWMKSPKCDCKQDVVVDSAIVFDKCTKLLGTTADKVLEKKTVTSTPVPCTPAKSKPVACTVNMTQLDEWSPQPVNCKPVPCTAVSCNVKPVNSIAVPCTAVPATPVPCGIDMNLIQTSVRVATEEAMELLSAFLRNREHHHRKFECVVNQHNGNAVVKCTSGDETVTNTIDIRGLVNATCPPPPPTPTLPPSTPCPVPTPVKCPVPLPCPVCPVIPMPGSF